MGPVKRCRDGNVCEAHVIPFLFGLFFVVAIHSYNVVHFVEMFFVTSIIMHATSFQYVYSSLTCNLFQHNFNGLN